VNEKLRPNRLILSLYSFTRKLVLKSFGSYSIDQYKYWSIKIYIKSYVRVNIKSNFLVTFDTFVDISAMRAFLRELYVSVKQ